MPSLEKLNDQQNHMLTQLSYKSHMLAQYEGLTINDIYEIIKNKPNKDDEFVKFKKCIEEMKSESINLGSLRIKDTGNDEESGFGAVAFTDEYGNTGISYRGTDGFKWESRNDWLDNGVSMATGTSRQCSQAEAFFNRNKDIDGMNYLYGHSKGGQLSESVYSKYYNEIKGVHLLNPQPLNPYSLTVDQLEAMQSDKIDIVIVEGDYVWFLGNLPSYGNIRILNNCGCDNAHLYYSSRYNKDGSIKAGQMPLWECYAYTAISILLTPIQVAGATIDFVYNCVVSVVDYAREQVWPKIKEFVGDVTKWISDTYNDLKDIAVQFGNYLSDIGKAATEWCKENFDKGYKYATNNTFIQIDTAAYRNLANRLSSVNKRITNLDSRMNSLYTKVNITDIYDVIKANVMTSYSWNIRCCINYLNDTASDFEEVERSIISQL